MLAVFCAVGWSLAYPLIKVGYGIFAIEPDDLGSKLLFAGVRFLFAGLLVLALCLKKKTPLAAQKRTDLLWLILLAVVNTTLHYMFAYLGLSRNPSSRSTILDSMGGFILIFLSVLFFEDDSFNRRKVIGCLLGVSGIVLINIDPHGGFFDNITFGGDGMILLNALCGGFGGVITRIVSRKMNIVSATGYSMAAGGGLLVLAGLCTGVGRPWELRPGGIMVLAGLVLISAVCFGIYNELLAVYPISEIAIYNALIPVLGVMFASVILSEPLKWQYFAAVALVAVGIRIVNQKTSHRDKQDPAG